jgi:hypothetical protein
VPPAASGRDDTLAIATDLALWFPWRHDARDATDEVLAIIGDPPAAQTGRRSRHAGCATTPSRACGYEVEIEGDQLGWVVAAATKQDSCACGVSGGLCV